MHMTAADCMENDSRQAMRKIRQHATNAVICDLLHATLKF
jgi:hypothetical protein